MAAAGFDHDGGEGFNRDELAVEFEVPFALEDEVDLGHFPMIVDAGPFGDFDEVDAGHRVVGVAKGAAGGPAWTRSAGDFIELGESVILHESF